jgi:hypothetical protein
LHLFCESSCGYKILRQIHGDPMQLARSMQAEIWEIDADLAVTAVASMNEVICGALRGSTRSSLCTTRYSRAIAPAQ